jgi:lipoate-protein ligase A
VGRFRDVSKDVQVANCRREGVDIVRRISGGGAVYHDYEGEITYSLVVNERDLGFPDMDIASAYKKICTGLIEGAKLLGTPAEFNPSDMRQCPNLTIKGRKISGSAQSYKRGILLQHGTFLLDLNHERMFTLLKVPWAKSLADVVKVSRRKLTSARHELQSPMASEEAYSALREGFAKALNVRFIEGELTQYEKELAEELRTKKYSTDDWNLQGRTVI